MVHLFSWFIFFPQWYRAAFCVSTSYSARATYPHCRTVLYSCITVVSIYYHIRFSSATNKHVLPYFSSVLPTCCMGVCVQCWVSCAFFLMVRVSHNCLQATGGHLVEEHCSTSLTEASPKHKDFCQFSLPENLFSSASIQSASSPSSHPVASVTIVEPHPQRSPPWHQHPVWSTLSPPSWWLAVLLILLTGLQQSCFPPSWQCHCSMGVERCSDRAHCTERGDCCWSPPARVFHLPHCLQRSPPPLHWAWSQLWSPFKGDGGIKCR